MTQGKRSSEEAIRRIRRLLANTDLTIPEIANRMGRSRANIVAINKKFKIRNYNKRRQYWEIQTTS
jgi:transcriptional regulator